MPKVFHNHVGTGHKEVVGNNKGFQVLLQVPRHHLKPSVSETMVWKGMLGLWVLVENKTSREWPASFFTPLTSFPGLRLLSSCTACFFFTSAGLSDTFQKIFIIAAFPCSRIHWTARVLLFKSVFCSMAGLVNMFTTVTLFMPSLF